MAKGNPANESETTRANHFIHVKAVKSIEYNDFNSRVVLFFSCWGKHTFVFPAAPSRSLNLSCAESELQNSIVK